MTHIEQMIQDMCPNGVEFKTLGEVATLSRGKVYSKEYLRDNAGEYPVYSSQTANNGELGRISTYDYDGKYLTWTTDGAYAGTVFRREGRFSITNVCGLISNVDKALSIDFLYYWLNKVAKGYVYQGMGNPKLMSNVMETIEIPLPPIEIQKKIVECLDEFSALAAELQAELQAELHLRRKQYEYYRTQLLTPHSDCNSATKSDDAQWEWKTLGEITLPAVNIKWKHVDATTEYQYVDLTSVNRENRNIEGTNIINKETAPSRAQQIIETGDILFGTTRPTLQRYCYVPKEYNGQICSTGYCVLRANKNVVLPKWIYYQLSLNSFIDYVTANQSGAAYPSISDSQVKAYKIPLPPLAEQERIVSILDKFEALTTSLSDGIPAEQAAQQKRYEYYRDLLLTFDRKAV